MSFSSISEEFRFNTRIDLFTKPEIIKKMREEWMERKRG